MVTQSKKNIPFNHVLAALLNSQNVFPPTYLHHFSDLDGRDLEALRSAWPEISPARRFTLLEDLEDLAETDTLVSFGNLARLALTDVDARVRTLAIRLLWEDEDPRLVDTFTSLLFNDPEAQVRAAAATGLGLFVYLGELEELPQKDVQRVEEALLRAISSSDDKLVRRRALESMGFSGCKEVPGLIRTAYDTNDNEWLASALFAMGRSADESWGPEVIRMLKHPRADVQMEAVRAAGNLEVDRSRRILIDLLEEEGQDSDVHLAIIWSLSQLGGEQVREALEQALEETEDEDEVEFLEKALDNLSFTEDVDIYTMFNFNGLGEANQLDEPVRDLSDIENEIIEPDEDSSASTGDKEEPARKRHKPGKPS